MSDIRNRTKVTDVISRIARLKWREPGKWTQRIFNWEPKEVMRGVWRPQRKWSNDVKNIVGRKCSRTVRKSQE